MKSHFDKLHTVSSTFITKEDGLYINTEDGKSFTGIAEQYYFSETNALEIVSLKSRTRYKGGKLDGIQENFTVTGRFKNGAVFEDGKQIKIIWHKTYLTERKGIIYRRHRSTPYTGEVRDYYTIRGTEPDCCSKSLKEIYTLIDGKREGIVESFFQSGALETQANYLNNQRHGVFRTFNDSGVSQIETYKSGVVLPTIKWLDSNDCLLFQGEFNKGRFESLWTKDHFDSLKKVFLETGQFFLRSLR